MKIPVVFGVVAAFLFVATKLPEVTPPAWEIKQPCGKPGPGRFRCHVLQCAPARSTAPELRAMLTPWRVYAQNGAPQGYGPGDIEDAYKLNVPTRGGQVVAVIVIFDDPTIEADLAVYRSTYGLPPCTTANGCFRKVNQSGDPAPLATPDRAWAAEAALDVEMVSAACPKGRILLIEAQDVLSDSVYISMNAAVEQGAVAVVNGFGVPEGGSEPFLEEQHYKHTCIAIVAPSGNTGYGVGVQFPASSQYVTAVGGTTLTRANSARGWSESVWGLPANAGAGTASGCSGSVLKPPFQSDPAFGTHRTVGDVAAVADPNTGVAVYDTYGGTGWVVDGGTDAAASIVAGIYGLANPVPANDFLNQYSYATPAALFDVTEGANGSCGHAYLCQAQVGYDGPTGLGAPNGVAAFSPPAQDFSFTIDPDHGKVPDQGGTVTATLTPGVIRGPAENVSFSTRIVSGNVTAAITPSTIETASSATLTITTAAETAPGKYEIEVIARGTQATHTSIYQLTVRPLSKPQVDITVTPESIQLGQTATLAWRSTQGPNSCFASRAWSGMQPATGMLTVSPGVKGKYFYRLDCYNDIGFSHARAVLTVTAPPPVVTIAVKPVRIAAGQSAQLSWEADKAKTCLASDSWTGSEPTTGQEAVAPTAPGTYRYTLTCTGEGGSSSASAVLIVAPASQ
jgi:hypothetical protein